MAETTSTEWATQLFGNSLLTKSGANDTKAVLQGKKLVLIYFSAHWCPPCRNFTPKLAEFIKSIKNAGRGDDIEIVFCSSDQVEQQFQEYFESMPWVAIEYSNTSVRQALGSKFQVRGIPTLVVLDGETGDLKTKDGRAQVGQGNPVNILDQWIEASASSGAGYFSSCHIS
eukprot:CAMPEP_0113935194 /NCGR_PEP_ID=MMETSP1339-20121228/2396_1 /TAXON_ID=94617 /ORGANISM="Fibrocapsa japonica" /LENGTH=170 /DNA_ID=CAMNT_0000937261 /DNA_START=45 /DNA_END=557 /DNA_ORIENTATION=+ /assembly_acc=CAM_ASM_000762